MQLRKLTIADVHFAVIESENDSTPEETASQLGAGSDFVQNVNEMIADHGIWGWCSVEVEGHFMGLKASVSLGGCSYKGVEDFKQDAYYGELCKEVVADLQKQADMLVKAFIVTEERPATLAEWAEQNNARVHDYNRPGFDPMKTVADRPDLPNRTELWRLSDYFVSSVEGGTIWLAKRPNA